MKKFMLGMLVFAGLVTIFPVNAQEQRLVIVTYDSFAISEDVQAAFEDRAGVRLEVLRVSDAGVMINQAILTADNPLGDVMYGVDNTFLSRALNADLFIPYESPGLEAVPEVFQLDAGEFRVTPVTYGDVCLNYDAAYFEANDLPLPQSLADLVDPVYTGLFVVQNPGTSSPGLAFLLATIAVFGDGVDDEDGYTYLDYWRDLVENDVLIVDGWSEAYFGAFSAASEDGDRPLVVSYASSPPVEVLFADPAPEAAPTGAIVADDTCFRQVEFVGILRGTQNLEVAQQFIDFTLSLEFQEDLPLQMFVFPVNEDAELPEIFVEYAQVPENPVVMDYDMIDANRERWIRTWFETVLR